MDFKLPQNYIKNNTLAKGNFIKGLDSKERERFDHSVKGIVLTAQIEGESIPSRIDYRVNAQVIMFITAMLSDIKNAAFVAECIQRAAKALTVVTVSDNMGNSILNFAIKRLSETDKGEIVIEDSVISAKYNRTLGIKFKTAAEKRLAYDSILNTTDKYGFYCEMAVKSYIISNTTLYCGVLRLLNSKIWYNADETKLLLERLKQIEQKKAEVKLAIEIGEQIRLNGEIRDLIRDVKFHEK